MFLAEIKNDINMNTLLLLNLGAGEIVLIALVVLFLFGCKKIPELMKGLGKGVRNFKDGLKDVEDQINSDTDSNSDKK